MPQNNIHGAEAGKAFADMLAQNTVLKELDLSNQQGAGSKLQWGGKALDAAFAKEFAVGISNNRALTSLDVSGNSIGTIVGWTHCPKNSPEYRYRHSSDGRGQEQLPDGDELGRPEGAIALANAIKNTRALTKLDISSCNLRTQGTKLLAEALKGNQLITELNIASNQMTWDDMSGVIAITDAISDMGTMTSLNLADNSIGGYDALHRGGRSHPSYVMFYPTPEGT
jgi:hypothetical protein